MVFSLVVMSLIFYTFEIAHAISGVRSAYDGLFEAVVEYVVDTADLSLGAWKWIFLAICSLPVVVLVGQFLIGPANLGISEIPEKLERLIEEMCRHYGLKKVDVVFLDSSEPYSGVEVGRMFGRNRIVVTKGLLKILDEEETLAVMAHEMGHILKHLSWMRPLVFLSQLTLMGRAYLVNIFNTYDLEFEADDIAVEYLEQNGSSRLALASALRTIAAGQETMSIVRRLDMAVGLTGTPSNDSDVGWFSLYSYGPFLYNVGPDLVRRLHRLENK